MRQCDVANAVTSTVLHKRPGPGAYSHLPLSFCIRATSRTRGRAHATTWWKVKLHRLPSIRSANAQHKLKLKIRLGQALGLKP